MRLLLEHDADVDRPKQDDGSTPLYVSCKNGHVDAVRLLLDRGADVDRAHQDGSTPTFIACGNGHVDALRLVLARGSNVELAMHDGRSPFYVACQEGFIESARLASTMAQTLITRARTTPRRFGFAAIRTTSTRCGCASSTARMSTGPTATATPLYAACQNGHVDAATLCLDRGADLDRPDNDGDTPLHGACFNGCIDAARLLLDRGAEVDRANQEGATPLHAACVDRHVNLARLCFAHGADINRTPLATGPSNGNGMFAWLARIRAVGWARYLSEPRYKLVVLRELAARGRARRERAFFGKEQ